LSGPIFGVLFGIVGTYSDELNAPGLIGIRGMDDGSIKMFYIRAVIADEHDYSAHLSPQFG
jgi:hypothetical protein